MFGFARFILNNETEIQNICFCNKYHNSPRLRETIYKCSIWDFQWLRLLWYSISHNSLCNISVVVLSMAVLIRICSLEGWTGRKPDPSHNHRWGKNHTGNKLAKRVNSPHLAFPDPSISAPYFRSKKMDRFLNEYRTSFLTMIIQWPFWNFNTQMLSLCYLLLYSKYRLLVTIYDNTEHQLRWR